jgi:hypothetical protein
MTVFGLLKTPVPMDHQYGSQSKLPNVAAGLTYHAVDDEARHVDEAKTIPLPWRIGDNGITVLGLPCQSLANL